MGCCSATPCKNYLSHLPEMVFGSGGSVSWQDLLLVSTVISGCEAAVAFLTMESSLWLLFIDPLRAGTQIRSTRSTFRTRAGCPRHP